LERLRAKANHKIVNKVKNGLIDLIIKGSKSIGAAGLLDQFKVINNFMN
jgi:hypothetical protein